MNKETFGYLTKPHMFTMDEQGQIVPCWDVLEWGEHMEYADRKVALTTIGRVNISTVFLGLDHSWEGPPRLFETMAWITVPDNGTNHGREWLDGQMRYSTIEAAREGHEFLVAKITERLAEGWQPWLLEDKDADSQS